MGYKIRTIRESTNCKIKKEKSKKTNLLKYGVENPSQLEGIKEKKKSTFIKNYSVDNIFKVNGFTDSIEGSYVKKYGMGRKRQRKVAGKKAWASLTEEKRSEWLNKSILSEKSKNNHKLSACYNSSGEKRIWDILKNHGITFEINFVIKIDKNHWRLYDIRISKTKNLIEFNGDYWHANPSLYKENDILFFKKGNVTASDIWAKDCYKKDLANKNGFLVTYIWENEIEDERPV